MQRLLAEGLAAGARGLLAGLFRVITHGETGFFAHEDREWHACLAGLVTDPSLRERVGTAARQHVLERYDVERIVADYLRLFDRLLGHLTPAQRTIPTRP